MFILLFYEDSSILPYNLIITLVAELPLQLEQIFASFFVYWWNVSNFPLLRSFFSI